MARKARSRATKFTLSLSIFVFIPLNTPTLQVAESKQDGEFEQEATEETEGLARGPESGSD
jgi:hypothetical protein